MMGIIANKSRDWIISYGQIFSFSLLLKEGERNNWEEGKGGGRDHRWIGGREEEEGEGEGPHSCLKPKRR